MTFTVPLITRAYLDDVTDLAAAQFTIGRSLRIDLPVKKNTYTLSLERVYQFRLAQLFSGCKEPQSTAS